MKKIIYTILSFSLFFLQSCGDIDDEYTYDEWTAVDWSAAADSTTGTLINRFWNTSGNYFNYGNDATNVDFHYWPNAHAMDVLIDAYLRTNDAKYSAYFDKWYAGIKIKNGNTYKNSYVDDMEWNALTMLRLYNITNDAKYLNTAKELWGWIKDAWTEDAGGGITWCTDPNVLFTKNACSNGPAAIIGARIYQITKDESDLNWAKKIYDWEKNTLVTRATGAISDHIVCETNEVKGGALTYNQGTYVGAAVELFQITGDETYLSEAQKVANYTISNLINTSNNILRDEGSGDNGLFKGIFIRYFLELIKVEELPDSYRNKYITFFNNNANVLWSSGVYKEDLLFGSAWDTAPVGMTQLTSQTSGCMMIEAKAAYDKWRGSQK